MSALSCVVSTHECIFVLFLRVSALLCVVSTHGCTFVCDLYACAYVCVNSSCLIPLALNPNPLSKFLTLSLILLQVV